MRLYAVKNNKNEYMSETLDFLPCIDFAMLFRDYEVALSYAPKDAKIVRVLLNEITDTLVSTNTIDYVNSVARDLGKIDAVPIDEVLDKIVNDLNSIDVEKIKTELNKFINKGINK